MCCLLPSFLYLSLPLTHYFSSLAILYEYLVLCEKLRSLEASTLFNDLSLVAGCQVIIIARSSQVHSKRILDGRIRDIVVVWPSDLATSQEWLTETEQRQRTIQVQCVVYLHHLDIIIAFCLQLDGLLCLSSNRRASPTICQRYKSEQYQDDKPFYTSEYQKENII